MIYPVCTSNFSTPVDLQLAILKSIHHYWQPWGIDDGIDICGSSQMIRKKLAILSLPSGKR